MNVELACPRCRKTIMLALSPVSAGNTLECTTCGEVIEFDAAPDLMAADRAIEELKKLGTPAPLTAGKAERPWGKFWGA
jgi:hypothetical protein